MRKPERDENENSSGSKMETDAQGAVKPGAAEEDDPTLVTVLLIDFLFLLFGVGSL